MNRKNDHERALAFAGILQALQLVQSIYQFGRTDGGQMRQARGVAPTGKQARIQ